MFDDSSDNINELLSIIFNYICFSQDTVVPSNYLKFYPNKKTRFDEELKHKLLNKQHLIFTSKDRTLLKHIQADITQYYSRINWKHNSTLKTPEMSGKIWN